MAIVLGNQLIYVAIAILKIELIHKSVDNVKDFNRNFDYIVIGLGSAGSVVAKRLAEDSNISVLGLEAGGSQSAFSDIPKTALLLPQTVYDWNFTAVPQKRMGLGFEGQRIPQERGKVIGGSSTINIMIYNRGNRKDYDNWAETYSAIGWDYSSVLKYFIKAENNSDLRIVYENPGFHGTNGPIGVSTTSSPDPILLDTIQALNKLGFRSGIDINGAQQLGTTITQETIKDGLRSSTANAYLEPNPFPNNLFLSINSYVTKIIIRNSIAIGVEFVKNHKKYTIYANKEVILCAGAIKSPQLLMLSGIGPKEHLDEFGIPVIVDLPVGNNLINHYNIDIYAIVNDPNKVTTTIIPDLSVPNLYQLYDNKSGILSQLPLSITYYNTKYNNDKSWPNTALFIGAVKGPDFTTLAARYDSNIRNRWVEYFSQFANKGVFNLQPMVTRTRSVGTIRLNTSKPFDPPLIDPKALSVNRDLEDFVEILKFTFFVMEESLISSENTIPKLPIPGCSYCSNKPIYKCDSYLKCLIRQMGRTAKGHQCGTCRMGSVNRNDVVVDERLRVKGIHNLRVCDTSIIPEIPNSNTNAAAIMIGEYGSDIIKADNR